MLLGEDDCNQQCESCQQDNVLANSQLSVDDLQKDGTLNKAPKKKVILLIGQTGVGKSTLANKIAQILGASNVVFVESQSQLSCTQECSIYEGKEIVIIDSPGLFDTTENKDELHVKNMVHYIKTVTDHINSIIFVFNGQVTRFDQSQKTILKLLMSSMGNEAMKNVGVVITKLPSTEKNATIAKEKAQMMAQEFTNMGIEGVGEELPYWFVDNHPQITNNGVKESMDLDAWEAMIKKMEGKRDESLKSLLDWSGNQANYDTKYIKYGAFDYKEQLKDQYEQQLNDLKADKEKLEATVKEKEETITKKDQEFKDLNQKYTTLSTECTKYKIQNEGDAKTIKDKNTEITGLKKDLTDLRTKNEKVDKALSDEKVKSGKLNTQVTNLNEQVTKLNEEKTKLDREVSNQNKEITNLKKQIGKLEQEVDDLKHVYVKVRRLTQRKYEIVTPYLPWGNCYYYVYERDKKQVKYPGQNWEDESMESWSYIGKKDLSYSSYGTYDLRNYSTSSEWTERRLRRD